MQRLMDQGQVVMDRGRLAAANQRVLQIGQRLRITLLTEMQQPTVEDRRSHVRVELQRAIIIVQRLLVPGQSCLCKSTIVIAFRTFRSQRHTDGKSSDSVLVALLSMCTHPAKEMRPEILRLSIDRLLEGF